MQCPYSWCFWTKCLKLCFIVFLPWNIFIIAEVSDFELNSERRAAQREDFELRKKEREAELEGQRRLREQRQKEEEEAAIAKLRAEMVHHPNPIRRYAPVVVKPSDKPLTEAESPRFSERLRAKVRLWWETATTYFFFFCGFNLETSWPEFFKFFTACGLCACWWKTIVSILQYQSLNF